MTAAVSWRKPEQWRLLQCELDHTHLWPADAESHPTNCWAAMSLEPPRLCEQPLRVLSLVVESVPQEATK